MATAYKQYWFHQHIQGGVKISDEVSVPSQVCGEKG